jgi:hypothetical protein
MRELDAGMKATLVVIAVVVLIVAGLSAFFGYMAAPHYQFTDRLVNYNTDTSYLYFQHGHVVYAGFRIMSFQIGQCYSVSTAYDYHAYLTPATGCS